MWVSGGGGGGCSGSWPGRPPSQSEDKEVSRGLWEARGLQDPWGT